MSKRDLHVPVLLTQVLEVLDPKPGQTIVDCTLGLGGHAAAILSRLRPGGLLIGQVALWLWLAMLAISAREQALWDSVDATPGLTDAQRLSSARGRTLCYQLTGLARAMRGEPLCQDAGRTARPSGRAVRRARRGRPQPFFGT